MPVHTTVKCPSVLVGESVWIKELEGTYLLKLEGGEHWAAINVPALWEMFESAFEKAQPKIRFPTTQKQVVQLRNSSEHENRVSQDIYTAKTRIFAGRRQCLAGKCHHSVIATAVMFEY